MIAPESNSSGCGSGHACGCGGAAAKTGAASAGSLDSIVARAEELARDWRLDAVRAWKARTKGLAVGFLPVWAPRELLHAQGVLPVGLMGAGDDLEIIRGDAYYQSYICHLPRSTIELGLNGAYDCLDGVIFPATCDVIRNLSGVWKLSFQDKLSFYLDVPQDFERELGGKFLRDTLLELAHELETRGAKKLSMDALAHSIRLYDENRALVRQLYALRRDEPWRVLTSELYPVLRAGLVLPVEEHNELLAAYQDAVRCATERRPLDQARVVVSGSFCEQPPLALLKTLERGGCSIVDDDFVQVTRWITSDVDQPHNAGRDALDFLVNAFLADSTESPVRYCAKGRKGDDLVRRVRASRAEGVLLCAPSFCDPALLDQPLLQDELDRAGIPWTNFKYAENTGQFQVIREQAGTFADSIKLWSDA